MAKKPKNGIRLIEIIIFASIDMTAKLNGVLVLPFAKNIGENTFCSTKAGNPNAKINRA